MLENKILSLKGRTAKILGHENTSKSSVLLPLVIIRDKYYVLFEKRALSLRRQPGEICFPGGARDPSDDYGEYTAIRESSEELGIPADDIEVIAQLDIMVSTFNAIIIPYLACIKDLSKLKINEAEVDRIILIPLDFFLDEEPLVYNTTTMLQVPDDFPFDLIPGGRRYPFRIGIIPQYFYLWENEVIWGLTASILHHFIDLLKNP